VIAVDTHAFLWMVQDSPRLSAAARSAVLKIRPDEIFVSTISLYEIAWLVERGRVEIGEPINRFIASIEARFHILAPDSRIAVAAAQLPVVFPSDPFDRIIAATAIVEGVPLITADRRIRKSRALRTIW
jgi:PIN domain nuclease of toxin-antitoxin system